MATPVLKEPQFTDFTGPDAGSEFSAAYQQWQAQQARVTTAAAGRTTTPTSGAAKPIKRAKAADDNDPIATTKKGSTIAFGVTRSKDDDSRKSGVIGGMTQKKSGLTFHHESTVTWNRRRWKFKLDVPVSKMPATDHERQILQAAIEKARDVFLADIKKRNSKFGTEDFQFVLTDKGYQAYVPTDKVADWDEDVPIKDAASSGFVADYVEAEGGHAQNLSTILQSCEPNLGQYISDQIDADPILSTLHKSSQKKTETVKAGPLKPVGFTNPSAYLCYLNTAVQQWGTNPLIRTELLKPGVIKGGETHPLYKALKAYDEAQQAEGAADLNLEELRIKLGLQKGVQEDEHMALQLLHGEIDFDKVSPDSPLYSTSKSNYNDPSTGWRTVTRKDAKTGATYDTQAPEMAQRAIVPQSGLVSDALKAQQSDGTTKQVLTAPPGVFTVHSKRYKIEYDKVNDKNKEWFFDRLISKNINPSELFDNVTDQAKFTATAKPEDKLDLAHKILTDPKKFELANGKLDKSEKDLLSKKIPLVKDTTSMDACDDKGKMKLPGELHGKPGEETTYDLMSFSHHRGDTLEGGHFVTYVKDGDTYWKISDSTKEKLKDSTEFYANSKTAYVLIYNREDLNAAAAASAATKLTSTVEGALSGVLSDKTYHHTQVVAGVGDILKRPNATLVNFTNITLDERTPIFNAAQIADDLKDKREAKKGYLGLNSEGHFRVGDAVSTDAGSLDKPEGIIHAVIPKLSGKTTLLDNDKEQLRQAVSAALHEAQKQGKTHVAFSLLDDTASDLNIEIYDVISKKIDEFAKKHSTDLKALHKIEIVLSQAQRDRISPSNAPKTIETFTNGNVTFEVQTHTENTGSLSGATDEPTFRSRVQKQIKEETTGTVTIDLRGSIESDRAAQIIHEEASAAKPFTKIQVILPESDAKQAEVIAALKAPLKSFSKTLSGDTTLTVETQPSPADARKPRQGAVYTVDKIKPVVALGLFQASLHDKFEQANTNSATVKSVTFDLRGKKDPGVQTTTNTPPTETQHAIDYRDFSSNPTDKKAAGISPVEVANAFQTELTAFLRDHPGTGVTFKVILPEEDAALQAAFQSVQATATATLVDPIAPAGYTPLANSKLQFLGQINEARFSVEAGPVKQPATTFKTTDLAGDIRLHLQTIEEDTRGLFPQAEEFIIDLRPGATVPTGLPLVKHPIYNLGDYNVPPQQALDALLTAMEDQRQPFTNRRKIPIRLIFPEGLIIANRQRIQATLDHIAPLAANLEFDENLGPLNDQIQLQMYSAPHPKTGTQDPSEVKGLFSTVVADTTVLRVDLSDYADPNAALRIFQEGLETFAKIPRANRITVQLIHPKALNSQIDTFVDYIHNEMLVPDYNPTAPDLGKIRYETHFGNAEFVVVGSKTARVEATLAKTGTKKTEQALTEEIGKFLGERETASTEVTIDLRPGLAGPDVLGQKFFRSIDARDYDGDVRSAVQAAMKAHKFKKIKKVTLMLPDAAAITTKPLPIFDSRNVTINAQISSWRTGLPQPIDENSLYDQLRAKLGKTVQIDLRENDQKQAMTNFKAALNRIRAENPTNKTTINLIVSDEWTEESVKQEFSQISTVKTGARMLHAVAHPIETAKNVASTLWNWRPWRA